jgi:hypothetical protein
MSDRDEISRWISRRSVKVRVDLPGEAEGRSFRPRSDNWEIHMSKEPDPIWSLPEALSRASQVASKLAAAADSLNKSILLVETAFGNLKLGVTAYVPMPLPGDREEWIRNLSFGKHNDQWRFLVLTGHEMEDSWTETPLLNCSKESRLAAVDLFEPLLKEMVKEAERQEKVLVAKAQHAAFFANHILPIGTTK